MNLTRKFDSNLWTGSGLYMGIAVVFTLVGIAFALIFAWVALSNSARAEHATLSLDSCYDLLAGQTIIAGDVCVSLDGDNILVEYQTVDGWELSETHAWVFQLREARERLTARMPDVRRKRD